MALAYSESKKSDDKLIICNEGGSRCFYPKQKVRTTLGHKDISAITTADKVLTYNFLTKENEFKPVQEVLRFKNTKRTVEITLKSDVKIICTDDHEFLFEGGFVSIKNILFRFDKKRIIETISNIKLHHSTHIELSDIESYRYVDEDVVYDLSIQDNHNYYIDAGNKDVLVHNSGKTFDTFALLVAICSHNINKHLDIYILRDTLTNCKDKTLPDFLKYLQICEIYDPACYSNPQKPNYELFGNTIKFRGLDDEKNTEGYPSDILFINEVLETKKAKVDGLLMRCRKLVIFDWNPKFTKHWIFDFEKRPNVLWTHSTYKDNKYLEKSVVQEIESYNPAIKENVKNGTANLFRWKVYGLGVRTDQEGNVFNDSELQKYDIKDIDTENAVKIAWCDVADQGIDYLCFLVGAIIDKKVYVIDVVFSNKGSEYTAPLIIELIKKYDIDISVFESNNQGLMFTKLLKQMLLEKYRNKIKAIPNMQNKHSRIVVQAETNIIKNFYFLAQKNGMYAEFYEFLTSYKHDKSFKQDDAPDALAGLSKLSSKYI
jgi:PBSX family phage terminase large subunit